MSGKLLLSVIAQYTWDGTDVLLHLTALRCCRSRRRCRCCCFHCCRSTDEDDYIRCTWQAPREQVDRFPVCLCVFWCGLPEWMLAVALVTSSSGNPDHQVWLENSLQNQRGVASHAWPAHMLRLLSVSLWTLLIWHLQLPNTPLLTHRCHAFISHSGVLNRPGMYASILLA